MNRPGATSGTQSKRCSEQGPDKGLGAALRRHAPVRRAAVVGAALALCILPTWQTVFAAHKAGASHKAGLSTKTVSGTVTLAGSMKSSDDFSMNGAFSVGQATNLDWDLPLPTSMQLSGFTQQVTTTFTFDVQPTSFQDITDDNGNVIRRFHWDTPPDNTVIHVVEKLHADNVTTLDAFSSSAPYPLSTLPSTVSPYVAITPDLQLPPSADTLLAGFTTHQTTERQVVESVANWVASNIHYDVARVDGPYQASWILVNKTAACRGFTNMMVAFLHKLGIPARAQFGWAESATMTLPGPHRSKNTLTWLNESTTALHTWLNVWFPDVGWVTFDPQNEKFFVDPRHVALFTNVDASTGLQLGTWSADVADDNTSAAGAPLSNGSAEIVPGNGAGSQVTESATDDFSQLKFLKFKADATRILYSR